MRGSEFVKKIKKFGRMSNVNIRVDKGHGKGSHSRIYYGESFTTIKDSRKEIGPGLLGKMLVDLGIDKDEFRKLE